MRPLDAVALRTSRQSGDTKFILTAALSFIGFRSFTFGYTHCSHPFLIILFEQISQNRKSWVNGRLITRAFFVVEILSAGGAKPSTILTAEDFHRHRKEQSLLNVRQKVDGIPFKKCTPSSASSPSDTFSGRLVNASEKSVVTVTSDHIAAAITNSRKTS